MFYILNLISNYSNSMFFLLWINTSGGEPLVPLVTLETFLYSPWNADPPLPPTPLKSCIPHLWEGPTTTIWGGPREYSTIPPLPISYFSHLQFSFQVKKIEPISPQINTEIKLNVKSDISFVCQILKCTFSYVKFQEFILELLVMWKCIVERPSKY